jgi:hypothetical protein
MAHTRQHAGSDTLLMEGVQVSQPQVGQPQVSQSGQCCQGLQVRAGVIRALQTNLSKLQVGELLQLLQHPSRETDQTAPSRRHPIIHASKTEVLQ